MAIKALPVSLPGFGKETKKHGWKVERVGNDGMGFVNKGQKLFLIISIAKEADGKIWAHMSLSGKTKLPSWGQLSAAKRLFLGDDSKAIQIVPESLKHVNIHPYCLHLFVCLEGDPLPEFSALVHFAGQTERTL